MDTQTRLRFEWVCSEAAARLFNTRLKQDGADVTQRIPFVPNAAESDLYADSAFEPLVVIGGVVAAGMVVRYVRELILDLRGREVAIIDFTGDVPQIRTVPVGKASQVIVKAPDGTLTRFAPSETDKVEANLLQWLSKQMAAPPAD